jgi:hypothetical protein
MTGRMTTVPMPSVPSRLRAELLFLSAGFEMAQQYGDYDFVRVDRTSHYVVTVARRPRGKPRRRECQ